MYVLFSISILSIGFNDDTIVFLLVGNIVVK